jgi:2-amino-4-hydroxy-6-hydroxymethyldihydropteridine diphosphokinase
MMANSFTICFGSNTDNARLKISAALDEIRTVADVIAQSEVYTYPSYTGIGKDYCNMVIKGLSDLSLNDFTIFTKQLEKKLGRTSESKASGVMPIDIDIICWNSETIRPSDSTREYFIFGLERCK